MDQLNSLLNYAKLAFGLGFVIFLHELGHFLLAKWNGVKVEKFSIGFGPSIFAFTWGETEYALAILPLGGFVKMLGESPEESSEENRVSDPRAYHNKSIGARMAIISAGVIVNLFLGVIFFSVVYTQGTEELAAKIGRVMPGSPAYLAGVKLGDEIMAIDGRRDVAFKDLMRSSSLSGAGQKLQIELKRPGQNTPIMVNIEPRREKGQVAPIVGIGVGHSLTLHKVSPSIPYPFVPLPGMGKEGLPPLDELKSDDVIIDVAVEGQSATKVDGSDGLISVLDAGRSKALTFTMQRTTHEGANDTKLDVKIPPCHVVDFGFRVGFEPIAAVVPGGPAEIAGFKVGDKIVKVDGQTDTDPIRLPSLCRDKAGEAMTFEVERAGAAVTLTATPDKSPVWLDRLAINELGPVIPNELVDVNGLGLAYAVGRRIVAVDAESPAAKAGLKVGDILDGVTFPPIKILGEKKPETPRKPLIVSMKGEKSMSWSTIFREIQAWPCEAGFEFALEGRPSRVAIVPEPVASWFYPERGLTLMPLIRAVPPQGLINALKRGWEDSVDTAASIYAMIRGLSQGRVGSKGLAGLPRILEIGKSHAEAGWVALLQFLAMLSINLAVLNFLPIPPLDGGQMVFLIGEKLRGKPLPDSALTFATLTGLVLVLALMVFTVSQDLLIMSGFLE